MPTNMAWEQRTSDVIAGRNSSTEAVVELQNENNSLLSNHHFGYSDKNASWCDICSPLSPMRANYRPTHRTRRNASAASTAPSGVELDVEFDPPAVRCWHARLLANACLHGAPNIGGAGYTTKAQVDHLPGRQLPTDVSRRCSSGGH